MADHHEYWVKAFGTGPRNGVIHAEGILPSISFSAPLEFLGEAGRWPGRVRSELFRQHLFQHRGEVTP
jgi:hypothetical protein